MVASMIIITPGGLGFLPTHPGNKHVLSTAYGLGSVRGAGQTEGKTVGEHFAHPQSGPPPGAPRLDPASSYRSPLEYHEP